MSMALVGEKAHDIHRRIGRNLLLFQGLEVSLKLALPYLVVDGRERSVEEIRRMSEGVRRWTLGPLMEQFRRSITVSEDFWVLTPEEVVAARNDLVHHFFYVDDIDHTSQDASDQAVRYLDRQFEMVQEIHTIVSMMGIEILKEILRQKANRTPEETAFLSMAERATYPGVEVIDNTQVPATGWQGTRIVRLLQRAEAETQPVDGYTLLSRAGALLRREDPFAHPRMYGYKRLSEVLEACGLFEVVRRPMQAGGEAGTIEVLYRSLNR
jgi:hypothetical protein